MAEKYPNVSPYAYAVNNPIVVIDPDGRDIIILSMGGGELRRITTDGPDRYIKVNQQAFNRASRGFTNDNQDYNTMLSVWSLRNQERNSNKTNLIAEQTGISMSVTGEIRENNNLIGDVEVSFQVDFDDQSTYTLDTYDGVAGGFGNGSPENGDYTVDTYRNREAGNGDYNRGMNRDGVGFSFNLDPTFDTGRSLLRIHPDGNNEGTLGCIGLSGNAQQLNSFRNRLNSYLDDYSSIPLNLNITNNPNNNGRNGNRIPNVNE